VPDKLSGKNSVNGVSFTVREGEIVCVAGIDGNGQSELVYALTGMIHPSGGSILLEGEDITHKRVRQRGRHGMAHIPEDRHRHGLVLDYNLAYNLVLQKYSEKRFGRGGLLDFSAIFSYADGLIKRFDIRAGKGGKTITRSMSGGNQQKAIIAREIDRGPRLLVAVQPTRGLDVGAIEYIHKQLIEVRGSGCAVLLISLELDEVMDVSDRILVMYEGKMVAEANPKTATYQELGLYMAGGKKEGAS
jgi:simple sugar transport system ATP-binding protein